MGGGTSKAANGAGISAAARAVDATGATGEGPLGPQGAVTAAKVANKFVAVSGAVVVVVEGARGGSGKARVAEARGDHDEDGAGEGGAVKAVASWVGGKEYSGEASAGGGAVRAPPLTSASTEAGDWRKAASLLSIG